MLGVFSRLHVLHTYVHIVSETLSSLKNEYQMYVLYMYIIAHCQVVVKFYRDLYFYIDL